MKWLDRIILGSIHLLLIVTPFVFTWVNDELFEFNKILFAYIFILIAGTAFGLKMIFTGKWLVKRTAFDIPIGVFVLSQIAATLFSIHPYTSIWGYYSRFNGGLISIFAYTALYYIVANTVSKKQLPTLVASLTLGLLGSSLYAFPEHFGVSPSCLLIEGQLHAQCWRQDVQHRVFGTFGQPNWLAAYIVALLPLTIVAFLLKSKANSLRQLYTSFAKSPQALIVLGAIIVSYPTLLFTKSRSGFLGFTISMIFLILGFGYILAKKSHIFQNINKKSIPTTTIVTASFLSIFLVASSAVIGTPFSPSISDLLRSDQEKSQEITEQNSVVNRLEVGGTDSGEIRMIVWQGAVNVWKRYPLFGSGVETFAYSYYKDRPIEHNDVSEWDFLYNKAHNEFLHYLATTGIVGLSAYLLLLGWFGVFVIYAIKKYVDDKTSLNSLYDIAMLLAVLSGIAGLSVTNFLGFSTVMVMIVMYVFFAIATITNKKENEKTALKNNTLQPLQDSFTFLDSASAKQWTLAIIFSITSLLLCITFVNRWRADALYTQGKNASQGLYLQQSIPYLTKAISLQPREALFYDELALTYARLGFVLAQQDDKSRKSQAPAFIAAAIETSDAAIRLNPVHLSFYKNRARVFLLLSEIDESYLHEAIATLNKAISLAPTDPKLIFTLSQVKLVQNEQKKAITLMEQAIAMRPHYEAVRMTLGQVYEEINMPEKAVEQYSFVLQNIAPENEVALQALERLQE